MMTATLRAVIQVDRIDAETIENIVVIVNGFTSAGMVSEQSGSPITLSSGIKRHTYDWSDMANCGDDYNVQAVATVVLRTTAASSVQAVTCPRD